MKVWMLQLIGIGRAAGGERDRPLFAGADHLIEVVEGTVHCVVTERVGIFNHQRLTRAKQSDVGHEAAAFVVDSTGFLAAPRSRGGLRSFARVGR